MSKKHEIIDKIIEYGIYLYIFLMFLAKGEGIRNILIFGGFALWLFNLKFRKNIYLLTSPISKLFWIYLGTILLSAIFSIEPLFSFISLKDEPLKSALLFPIIATVMADEEKLKKAIHVSFFSALLIVLAGYYSYIFHDMTLLKPDTFLVHAWHNKFARYLCTLLSLSFILYFIWRKPGLKIFLTIFFLISFVALMLSTSRAGIAAFMSIVIIWSLYLSKKYNYNLKKVLSSILIIFMVLGALFYFSVPNFRTRINSLQDATFNERTEIWISAVHAIAKRPVQGWGYGNPVHAIAKRPVQGWGYGNRIFHIEEPYRKTPYESPPEKGPHNSFIKVLFHQGITGLIPYTLMILTAITFFWKYAFRTTGIRSYTLVSCASILIGNYILHAMLASPKLIYLSVILGLGMAAKGIGEDSHN
jgi:O-antigen ligase